MADNNILPKAQSPVTDAAGRPTRAFYDFFRALVNRVQGQIDALTEAVATLAKVVASLGGDPDDLIDVAGALDGKADKSITVAGRYSIGGGGALDSDVYLWLKGDIETPPTMSFYGVLDETAGRGWNLISDNFAAVDNGDDTYTIDLADLTDTGTGTFKLLTRDAKGRLSGTLDGSASDVPYDNADSGLDATDVQAALDELAGSGSSLNYAINGGFDVWQRGTSFAVTSVTAIADCWKAYCKGSTIAVTRESAIGSGLPDAARFFCRCDVTAGTDADSIAQLILRVEDVRQFAGKRMSYILMARASIDTTIGANLVQLYGNNAGDPMYGVGPLGRVAVDLVADTWAVVESGAIEMPVVSLPHEPDAGSDGLQVSLWMNAGTDYDDTGFVIGLNSGVYDWALLVVSDGKAAIARTELDDEIRRCQRYYEKSFPPDTAPAQNAGLTGAHVAPQVVGASTATTLGHVAFKSTKPHAPTLTLFNPSATNAQPRNVGASADFSSAAIVYASRDGFGVTATSPASSSAGQLAAFHWTCDADLDPAWNGVDPIEGLSIIGDAPNGTIDVSYSYAYTATGGVPPYTWSISAGALPDGLTLGTTGEITGTPTTAGAFSWTVHVEDSIGGTFSLPDSASMAYATLAITGDFPDATVGVAYSESLPITGGLEPYTLTGGTGIVSGALGAGFALSITGTTGDRYLTLACASPATADTMTFTASVDSDDGQTATSPQSVVVASASASYNDLVASYAPDDWWKLEETTGTTAAGSGSSGYNGAMTGGATFASTGVSIAAPTGYAGLGRGVDFSASGVDDVRFVSGTAAYPAFAQPPIAGDPWTIVLTVAGSSGASQYLASRINNAAIIYQFVSDTVEFYSGTYGGSDPRPGSQIPLDSSDTTTPHQLVYRYDSGVWSGFKDGAQVFSVSRTFIPNGSFDFYLGSDSSTNRSNCKTWDYQGYNRALTDTEIADMWAARNVA